MQTSIESCVDIHTIKIFHFHYIASVIGALGMYMPGQLTVRLDCKITLPFQPLTFTCAFE